MRLYCCVALLFDQGSVSPKDSHRSRQTNHQASGGALFWNADTPGGSSWPQHLGNRLAIFDLR